MRGFMNTKIKVITEEITPEIVNERISIELGKLEDAIIRPPSIPKEQMIKIVEERNKKSGNKLGKEQIEGVVQQVEESLSGDADIKKILNISNEQLSEIYSWGTKELEAGRYSQAAEIFKVLLVAAPDEAAIAISLGICHQRLKKYDLALVAYANATIKDPSSPIPWYYGYDCHIHLGNKEKAKTMLEKVIEISAADPIYTEIKERSKLLLDSLKKQLGQP